MSDSDYDHNRFDEEKIADARRKANEAATCRKSLKEIGYEWGQGPYEDGMATLYSKGSPKGDRTGTGTFSLAGIQMRFNLAEGFPLLTTKLVAHRSVILELIWFLLGCTNNNWLKERGVKIWNEWAKENGDLGPVYGKQWRAWPDGEGGVIDQIAEVIRLLKVDPDSRRIVVSAWNVAMLKLMALMPCHAFIQFVVIDGKLHCVVTQRSADWFLGVPFNIASYAALTHMIAQQAGLEVGDLVWNGGDCHLYVNHMKQAELQLSRKSRPSPQLIIKRKPDSIDGYDIDDFEVVGYDPHPHIKADVAK